ncbi:hypothetical protein EK21DRAFT_102447 [Setomelanomma holmii]|uniref:Pinin/SDK/MemA protein domain-containing protein n=1 Tax=Setomelanomma holmii TaxID=210430 RepID=A0A9P4LL39_9PLEO|nr:hypothetical protein EK21DRAFT_102447 [Setomelanomma holmii]
MDGPIASAVVLPDDEPLPAASPTNSHHKRRQSSITEETAKRPRLDDEGATIEQRGSAEVKPVRRERGRERRLFGAVLGALSQAPSTTAAQKRRSEIEKRQLAQRKQESEESEQRKAERVARRNIQRWKEQKRFEEASYYKPWETSPDEDDRIDDQIAEARATIKRELEDYEARQEQEADRERHVSREGASGRDAEGSINGKGQIADALSTSNGAINGSQHSPKDQDMDDQPTDDASIDAMRGKSAAEHPPESPSGHQTTADDPSHDNHDDNGEDVIEEAAEDTVIY